MRSKSVAVPPNISACRSMPISVRGIPRRRCRSARRKRARCHKALAPSRRAERPARETGKRPGPRVIRRLSSAPSCGFADENVVVLGRPQYRDRMLPVVNDSGHRDVVLAAPGERKGDVGQVQPSGRSNAVARAVRALAKRRGGSVPTAAAPAGRSARRALEPPGSLLDDDVRVGAAHPERADPGPTNSVPFPWAVLALHDERTLVQTQFRVRTGEMQRRGNRFVLQAQNRFDQARDAGSHLQVADVRLDRPQNTRSRTGRLGHPECRSQPLDFDGVTERGAGSVGLDIAHSRRIDARHRVGFGDDIGLSGRIGRRVPHFHGSVVVDRRSADDGVNPVAGVDGGLQWFEGHHCDTAAEDRAVGPHVEGPAVADRRHHRSR